MTSVKIWRFPEFDVWQLQLWPSVEHFVFRQLWLLVLPCTCCQFPDQFWLAITQWVSPVTCGITDGTSVSTGSQHKYCPAKRNVSGSCDKTRRATWTKLTLKWRSHDSTRSNAIRPDPTRYPPCPKASHKKWETTQWSFNFGVIIHPMKF